MTWSVMSCGGMGGFGSSLTVSPRIEWSNCVVAASGGGSLAWPVK